MLYYFNLTPNQIKQTNHNHSVPYDVFYPFEIYSGAERIGWALLPVAVGIVGMLMNMN